MELHLHSPPEWALTVGDIGRGLVWAAAAFFLLSQIGWLFATRSEWAKKVGAWGFTAGAASLFGVFISLGVLFANNRFEYAYVWSHADRLNTLPYRIAGIWSGQEGSFLLWGVCAAAFGILAVRRAGDFRRWFTIPYAGFLCGIAGILAFESPFNLNLAEGKPIVPPDGVGLAPSLQNYWVTIHPPTIFLGFGSLTVLFAFAIAAMVNRDWAGWVHKVRPWSLVSLTLVGLGLCMGGFWAYETLGWGGFWMWDPVENTSFVPWCLNAALVHGIIVQTTKGKWHWSNLLFAALPFLAFMYGTFLTRSGFLSDTSVHSFAQMDSTALKVLIGIGVVSIGVFLGLWIRSAFFIAKEIEQPASPQGIHREGFYRWGNFVLVFFALSTAVGMSMPWLMSLTGQKPKAVVEQLYHFVLSWPFFPLMLLMAIAPFIRWNGEPFFKGLGKLYGSFCITIGLLGTIMLLIARTPFGSELDLEAKIDLPYGWQVSVLPWMMVLVGVCLFALVANIWRIVEMSKRSKPSIPAFLSHVGVAVLLLGLVVSRGFEKKAQLIVQEGRPAEGLGYKVAYKETTGDLMDRNNKVVFELERNDEKFEVKPGLYYIRRENGQTDPMVWPHIERMPMHDVYFTLHPMELNASDVVSLSVGETGTFDRFAIKYVKRTREGENGQVGTKFGAMLEVSAGPHTIKLHPQMEMTNAGVQQIPAKLGDDYFMTLQGIDAATGAAHLQLHYIKPLYPVELFYKPMTGLVWGGTGILTLAGFWAAWVRRRAAVVSPEELKEELQSKPADDAYAPSPAPQI